MEVRAKFQVVSIDPVPGTRYNPETKEQDPIEMSNIKLEAVMDGTSQENKEFFEATPSGQINLNCANQEAAKAFEIGAQYYVDFTKAE